MKITTLIIAALSTAALASESQFEFSHSCNTCFQMWNECMADKCPSFELNEECSFQCQTWLCNSGTIGEWCEIWCGNYYFLNCHGWSEKPKFPPPDLRIHGP